MLLDWENPFGNRSSRSNWGPALPPTIKTESGLYIPRSEQIDIEKIRREQLRLVPYFEELHEAATEMLENSDFANKQLSQRSIIVDFTYRRPNNPAFVNELAHEVTSHTVTLTEDGAKSHPIIEQLFPLRPFAALSIDEQRALRAVVHMNQGCRVFREADMPTHIRIVFPETIHFIMHWLTSIDGPIKQFSYSIRPVNKDTIHSNVSVYEVGPGRIIGNATGGFASKDSNPHRLH